MTEHKYKSLKRLLSIVFIIILQITFVVGVIKIFTN